MIGPKVYVEVCAMFDREGNMTPISVTWENGTVYPINKVVDVRRCVGGYNRRETMQYVVYIGKCKTKLFYEDPAWYVERKSNR